MDFMKLIHFMNLNVIFLTDMVKSSKIRLS